MRRHGISAYGRPIIEKRRSWRPTDFSSIVADYCADYAALGANATLFNLKIGGVNPTQATGSKQPVNTASQINGHPAWLFDGSDDFVTVSTSIAQPIHVFAICKITPQSAASNHDIPLSFSSSINLLVDSTGSGGSPRTILQAGSSLSASPQLAVASTFTLLELLYNGASSSIIETTSSGSTSRASGSAGTDNATSITIGALPAGTHSATITVARYVVSNAQLTGSKLSQLRSYLLNRYGL